MEHQISRDPYVVVYQEDAGFKDTYGGVDGLVVVECMRIYPQDKSSDRVIVFSHPIGGGSFLPIMGALAKAGFHVIFVNPRYRGNDTALIMEKAIADLGAGIRDAKKRFNYGQVILGGWSGGGSQSLFLQDQAENPTITHTPAGDPYDLTKQDLVPADGLMLIAAHVSRAITLTEWLDPSIINEADPTRKDAALDIYDADNPDQPPYSSEFMDRYRAAQIARNRRITAWVKDKLAELKAAGRPNDEFAFVVHGTMADPRFLDPTLEPSDRIPGVCYLGDPQVVNNGPVGIARFCTLRSWLSQWSYDETNADGIGNASRISCPVLVINNSADDACMPSHGQRLFDAVSHDDKELKIIKGATHYYAGQKKELAQCIDTVANWIERKFGEM